MGFDKGLGWLGDILETSIYLAFWSGGLLIFGEGVRAGRTTQEADEMDFGLFDRCAQTNNDCWYSACLLE